MEMDPINTKHRQRLVTVDMEQNMLKRNKGPSETILNTI